MATLASWFVTSQRRGAFAAGGGRRWVADSRSTFPSSRANSHVRSRTRRAVVSRCHNGVLPVYDQSTGWQVGVDRADEVGAYIIVSRRQVTAVSWLLAVHHVPHVIDC